MKIYLDDVRPTPEGWVRTYTPAETINYLRTGNVSEVSLDHDLGDDEGIGTGYDVLRWIEEMVHLHNYVPPIMLVHSANPPARKRMQDTIDSIHRFLTLNQ